MNNKGFTLVELLAVMVILLSISVVAVTNVTASLKRTEAAELKSYENLAINAAKVYFSMAGTTSPVQISTLISNNYLKDDQKFSDLQKNSKSLKYNYVKMCTSNYQVVGSSSSACS